MACIHLKQKLNNSLYCKKHDQQIDILQCLCCPDLEYKRKKFKPMKKVSKRLIEAQTYRWSIIYPTLTRCAVCGAENGIELNEVYEGARRGASMTYGFVIPLCHYHHDRFHHDRSFALVYKKMFQQEFEKTHSRDEFIKIMHKSYL